MKICQIQNVESNFLCYNFNDQTYAMLSETIFWKRIFKFPKLRNNYDNADLDTVLSISVGVFEGILIELGGT